jgi:hypothetical protein
MVEGADEVGPVRWAEPRQLSRLLASHAVSFRARSLRPFRQVLERIRSTVMSLNATIWMNGCFEERVMWALRIIPVFVSGRPRLTIGIFNLLDDFLSPRERLENLVSLEPSSVF